MLILFYVQKFVVLGNTELCRLEHFPIFNHIIHSLSKLFDFFFQYNPDFLYSRFEKCP